MVLHKPLLLPQEVRAQARLAGPLGVDLMLTHMLTLVALASVAKLGTEQLAVVALGTTVYELAGRLVLGGLCNALDTAAAQACSQCPNMLQSGSHQYLLRLGCSPRLHACVFHVVPGAPPHPWPPQNVLVRVVRAMR